MRVRRGIPDMDAGTIAWLADRSKVGWRDLQRLRRYDESAHSDLFFRVGNRAH